MLGDNFPSQHIVHHGALTRNEKIEKDKGLPRGRTKGRVLLPSSNSSSFLDEEERAAEAAALRHGWCWGEEWEKINLDGWLIFCRSFYLSFYYKYIHTYLMDDCRDVMNKRTQTKKGIC